MTHETAYTIVRTEPDMVTERVDLRVLDGLLSYTINDGPEVHCGTNCVETAISSHPVLNEVRPKQLTTIVAIPEVSGLLPLLLVPTGDWGEYDWSSELEEHITDTFDPALPHDMYRVVFVNAARWRLWHTDIGDRLLPGSDSGIMLMTTWASASVYEVAEMNSGQSRNTLGLATPSIVVEIDAPDTDGIYPEEGSTTLRLQRWDGTNESAAGILARWICSSPASLFFDDGGGTQVDPKAYVQLFVEAAASDGYEVSSSGEELVESTGEDFGVSGRGDVTTFFTLAINVASEVVEFALEKIAAEPEYRELIVAARDPQSPEAAAKAERIARLREDEEF